MSLTTPAGWTKQAVLEEHNLTTYKGRENKQPTLQSQTYHYYLHNTLHKIHHGIKQKSKQDPQTSCNLYKANT